MWAGAGLSLAWLGSVLAAVTALDALRRGPAAVGALVVVVSLVAVVPLHVRAIRLMRCRSPPASERSLPAYVVAQAENDPRVTTLQMIPEPNGGLRATLEHGTGTTLDDQSTLDQTRTELTDDEVQLAPSRATSPHAAGSTPRPRCASSGRRSCCSRRRPTRVARRADRGEGAHRPRRQRRAHRGGRDRVRRAVAIRRRRTGCPAAQIPANAGGWVAGLITAIQVIVLGAALLLSIPTGAGREADRRAPRRTRAGGWSPRRPGPPAHRLRRTLRDAGRGCGRRRRRRASSDEPGDRTRPMRPTRAARPPSGRPNPSRPTRHHAESAPQTRRRRHRAQTPRPARTNRRPSGIRRRPRRP